MSIEVRTEALRIASHLGGEPERVVKAAEQFFTFLNGKSASSKSAETVDAKVETAKVETKTETPVEPKTETPVETIDAKVARLAKELLGKSRPKLIATLKDLGVERARDLKPDQLVKAGEAFEKAIKEA